MADCISNMKGDQIITLKHLITVHSLPLSKHLFLCWITSNNIILQYVKCHFNKRLNLFCAGRACVIDLTMSSDQVVLSPPNPQLATQEPLHFLDSPDAPLIKRTEEIIRDFQEIVDVYNQPASPPPTDDLLVRMTAHSRALRDFQSYCFTGIQEMKAYVEQNMAQWRQTQTEELNRLKIALEKQNRCRKQEAKTLKTVEAQLQAKESALKDAEKEMKQQAKKVEELQKKLTAAQEETRNRETAVQAHELKIQQLNSQVGTHKKELIEAKKHQPNLQTVAVEKKAFESRVADLNRGLASAQSKAKTEEGKATAARKACQAAVEKQQALARELQDVRQNLEDVRRKAQSDLQAQASSFTGQDERWMERLFRLEQGHSQAKQSLEAQIHDLQDSVQMQSQEIERQHGVIQRQQEQIQNQQEQIQSLRQDLKDANNDRQMLKQMVLDLQEQVKGIEKGIQPFGVSLLTSLNTNYLIRFPRMKT